MFARLCLCLSLSLPLSLQTMGARLPSELKARAYSVQADVDAAIDAAYYSSDFMGERLMKELQYDLEYLIERETPQRLEDFVERVASIVPARHYSPLAPT